MTPHVHFCSRSFLFSSVQNDDTNVEACSRTYHGWRIFTPAWNLKGVTVEFVVRRERPNWVVYPRTSNCENKQLSWDGTSWRGRQKISESTSWRHICKDCGNIHEHREQLDPSLGVMQGGHKHHRNSNAPTFADRDPNKTLFAENDVRITAWQWSNILYRIRRAVLENEATFLKPKTEYGVRQPQPSIQTTIFCWILCICANDEQKQSVTRGIGHSQSVTILRDCHHGEWVDRHNRGGCSLRERFGDVRHSPTSWNHSNGTLSGKTLRRIWIFIQVERRPKSKSHRDWQDYILQLKYFRAHRRYRSITWSTFSCTTPRSWHQMNKTQDGHRVQDLPRLLEELTEHLVEPRSTFSGSDRKDLQEPPRPAILPAKAPKVKQRLFMHFPKDTNCDICKRKRVTRAVCRRNSQSHMRRTTKFGNIITADHKVLSGGRESRNNQRYAIVVQDLATQWIGRRSPGNSQSLWGSSTEPPYVFSTSARDKQNGRKSSKKCQLGHFVCATAVWTPWTVVADLRNVIAACAVSKMYHQRAKRHMDGPSILFS